MSSGMHSARRAAAFAAMATVLLVSGVNGALLDTGLGNVIEFIIGAVLGLAAVLVSVGLVTGLQRLLGDVPAVAGIGGALLALWLLLKTVRLRCCAGS